MVDNNDSLMREVEAELRKEKAAKLWDKYGVYVVGAVALLLALVGGHQLWQTRQQSLAYDGGALFEQALQLTKDGKAEEAGKSYAALAEGGHRGYATLAALQLAAADLKAGKTDTALAQFEKIASDSTADPMLKNFATLQAASLRLGTADLPEMQNRLNALAVDGNPWRFSARELLGLAAYKAGDIVAATREFDRILSDTGAPSGVAQRVRVLMGTIMAQTLAKVPAPTAPAAEPKADAAAPKTETPAGPTPDAKAADDKSADDKGTATKPDKK